MHNFPLNCSLAPPTHAAETTSAVISHLYPTSKYKLRLVVWEYIGYRKDEHLFVLKGRHSSQKLVTKQPQKHHPSVEIQLCPIYNLRLKPYDVRDAEWIQNPVMTINLQCRCHIKRAVWWINQKQSCQITTWSSVWMSTRALIPKNRLDVKHIQDTLLWHVLWTTPAQHR